MELLIIRLCAWKWIWNSLDMSLKIDKLIFQYSKDLNPFNDGRIVSLIYYNIIRIHKASNVKVYEYV